MSLDVITPLSARRPERLRSASVIATSAHPSRERRNSTGQSMTEYALLVASIAIVAYVAYFALGDELLELLRAVTRDL